MRAPLGKCPACDAAHDPRRVLSTEVYSSYPAPGVDTEVWFWNFRFSCVGCLSVVKVREGANGLEVTLETAGAVVTRLRERLVAARTAGTLSGELASLSLQEWILLGTPELFPEVAEGLGRRLQLSAPAVVRTPEESLQTPSEGVAKPAALLEPAPKRPRRPPEDVLPTGTALGLLAIREGRPLCDCPSAGGRNFLVHRSVIERAD